MKTAKEWIREWTDGPTKAIAFEQLVQEAQRDALLHAAKACRQTGETFVPGSITRIAAIECANAVESEADKLT